MQVMNTNMQTSVYMTLMKRDTNFNLNIISFFIIRNSNHSAEFRLYLYFIHVYSPFEQLFACIILVINDHSVEAKTIFLGSSCCLCCFDKILLPMVWTIILEIKRCNLQVNDPFCITGVFLYWHQPVQCSSSSRSHCMVHCGSHFVWCLLYFQFQTLKIVVLSNYLKILYNHYVQLS